MMPDRYMPDVIAPKILYDFIRAIKAPGRARRGEVLDEEEALNTALNMFGGGLATSGSVPIGALGMSARTAPAGTVPLREIQRSPLGFYSKVEEATLPLQNKGSGGQFLAQIQKTPGVKPEEIEVLGLDKFLQSKPTVTKQEVQDYITANKPDVQEVRLDSAKTLEREKLKNESFKALEQVDQAIPNLSQLNRANLTTFWAPGAQAGNVDDLAKIQALNLSESQIKAVMDYGAAVNRQRDFIESSNGYMAQPKFASYTIPGGENYRELLLTLPDTKGAKLDARRAEIEAKGVNATDTEKQEWASIMNQLQPETRDVEGLSPFRNRPEFRSSHYDQPNILTHLRANDRVIDGKKALFIEEIQSDWHQAGRKKGYQSKDIESQLKVSEERMAKRGQEIRQLSNRMAALDDTQLDEFNALAAERQRLQNLQGEETDLGNRLYDARREGVPDAPFKKSWHELALKRAIQEASEKGYDQIAFTTGKTQAERYDLSKQIDEINVVGRTDALTGEQTKSVALDTTKGQSFRLGVNKEGVVDNVNDENISNFIGKSLDEIIGKDLAKKVMDGGSQTISGEGLKVGGEGMKGFYDQILPKSLEKLGKKFDAKVTKTKMKVGEDVTEPGIVAPGIGMEFSGKTTPAPEVEVWKMDITPKMRESVLTKGQPLFAGSPAFPIANQDPLMQFLGMGEAENDPLMQFLGQK
jgi:hypothetical protein